MRQLVSLKQSKGRLAMAFRGSRQLQQHPIVLETERNLRDPLVSTSVDIGRKWGTGREGLDQDFTAC